MANPINLEVCVIGSDYVLEDGKPVVRVWGKTKKGETVLVLDRQFRPYFYIEQKADFNVIPVLAEGLNGIAPEKIEIVEKKLYGKQKNVVKLTLTSPSDVPEFKMASERLGGVKATYEYNIAYYKRYLIDKGIVPLNWVVVKGEQLESKDGVDFVVDLEDIERIESTEYPKIRILVF